MRRAGLCHRLLVRPRPATRGSAGRRPPPAPVRRIARRRSSGAAKTRCASAAAHPAYLPPTLEDHSAPPKERNHENHPASPRTYQRACAVRLFEARHRHRGHPRARVDGGGNADLRDATSRTVRGRQPDGGRRHDGADKDIIDNAVSSKDHTTLVAAIQAAGLVETLKGPGPFTVFAPVNAAFDALPAGTVDTLLKPEMKADLTKVLTYHVVPGKLDAASLVAQIQAGGGSATLTTVQGGTLTAKLAGDGVSLTDAKGNAAMVTTADVMQSNGVIHVIDKVLMP